MIADSASQLEPARRLGEAIARGTDSYDQPWPASPVILAGGSSPTRAQVAAAGVDPDVESRNIGDLFADPTLLDFDAIVAMLPGTRLLRLRRSVESLFLRTGSRRRPVLVTGYNGIVYEYEQEGLLWRLGYDVICVNSEKDRRTFSRICGDLDLDDDSLLVSGVLMARGMKPLQLPKSDADIKTVIFAPQAIVPRRRVERIYILKRLIEYARRHPEREVIVKPRTRPGERTFHVERYPFETLWREDFGQTPTPPNLRFSYGGLGDHLRSADLLVTVSSTAVFEALAHGVRACVLEDFGLRERMGTHFFTGSGLNASFDALLEDRIPMPNSSWLEDNGLATQVSLDTVADTVRRVQQKIFAAPDNFLRCYYTEERTPQVIDDLVGEGQKRLAAAPRSWSLWMEERLDRTHRKAKKLIRSPRAFIEDSGWLRNLRRQHFGD